MLWDGWLSKMGRLVKTKAEKLKPGLEQSLELRLRPKSVDTKRQQPKQQPHHQQQQHKRQQQQQRQQKKEKRQRCVDICRLESSLAIWSSQLSSSHPGQATIWSFKAFISAKLSGRLSVFGQITVLCCGYTDSRAKKAASRKLGAVS